MPIAMGLKEITNPELRTALKRASREGVVDAQEIFHLYSLGAQSVATGLIGALSRISQPTLPVCMWMPKTAQAIIAKTG